jgi:hypothetical protein
MELGQGLPVILELGREYANIHTPDGVDCAYTLDNVAEGVEGIPVVHVDSGRTLARRVASLRPEQWQD